MFTRAQDNVLFYPQAKDIKLTVMREFKKKKIQLDI